MTANSDSRKYRIEVPNLYDDSDLDPYQFRILVHILRRGTCYENDRSLAESCQMSLGKANEVKKWLIKQGWIEYTVVASTGQKGLRAVDKWLENSQRYGKTRSLHEHSSLPDERRSPDEKQSSPHERHLKKEPIQEEPSQELSPPEAAEEKPVERQKTERQIAIGALERHFSDKSGLELPERGTEKQKKAAQITWWSPLGSMWGQVDKQTEVAKQHITAVIAKMRQDGMNISSPGSILKVYQSRVAAEKTGQANGTGGGVKVDYFAIVLKAMEDRTVAQLDQTYKQVINAFGGVKVIQTRPADKEGLLRRDFNAMMEGRLNGQ